MPKQLDADIRTTFGNPVAAERLGGMSGSDVWRLRCTGSTVVVKASTSAVEAAFYETITPSLCAAEIPIPDLLLAYYDGNRHRLVIEDVPGPLPAPVQSPHHWRPDPRIITILARLHAVTRAQPPNVPDAPVFRWTDEMTASACSCPQTLDAATKARLSRLQFAAQSRLTPWCWISSDPNPRNWGVRADVTPVLFDWEQFGPGHPATDLAIIVLGLGDLDQYRRTASAYLAASVADVPSRWDADSLGSLIGIAKAATVVQLLHGHVNGTANVSDDLLNWLVDAVPAWVRTICA